MAVMKKTRVLIVDDHALLREGLAMYIASTPDLAVAGTAEDAASAMQFLNVDKPDLMTLDLSMPGVNGLELIKQTRVFFPGLRILVVSMHKEGTYAERCLKAGAHGYIMKSEPPEAVVQALRKILRGEIAVSPVIANQMLHRVVAGGNHPEFSSVSTLSDRELEVFERIGQGLGTREIAEKMLLSIKTVQYYRETIKKKLGLQNGSELVHRAYAWVHGLGVDGEEVS